MEEILKILNYFEQEYELEGWVTNLTPEKTAQNWIMNGFSPEEVWRYLEARCPIPLKASELRSHGITPAKAALHYGFDEDDFPMNVGEAFCADEADIEAIESFCR